MKPAPYPADTRAKGWRFEIDMEKIKASDTWLRAKTGEVRGALLLLWSEAWQQTPCGTLPNDDELVALLIDMPAAAARGRASGVDAGDPRGGRDHVPHLLLERLVEHRQRELVVHHQVGEFLRCALQW